MAALALVFYFQHQLDFLADLPVVVVKALTTGSLIPKALAAGIFVHVDNLCPLFLSLCIAVMTSIVPDAENEPFASSSVFLDTEVALIVADTHEEAAWSALGNGDFIVVHIGAWDAVIKVNGGGVALALKFGEAHTSKRLLFPNNNRLQLIEASGRVALRAENVETVPTHFLSLFKLEAMDLIFTVRPDTHLPRRSEAALDRFLPALAVETGFHAVLAHSAIFLIEVWNVDKSTHLLGLTEVDGQGLGARLLAFPATAEIHVTAELRGKAAVGVASGGGVLTEGAGREQQCEHQAKKKMRIHDGCGVEFNLRELFAVCVSVSF